MQRLTLPDGRSIQQANPVETVFLYNEVFTRRVYLQHGVRVPVGGTVVDVGANLGLFTMLATDLGAASVLAVEPIPSTCAMLRANVAAHSRGVTVLECALGSLDERTTFTHYPHLTMMSGRDADPARDLAVTTAVLTGGGRIPLAPAAGALLRATFTPERVDVQVRRLSDVLAEHALAQVDLLKVDVERAELDVLRGVDDADWPRIRQVVAEVHDEGSRLADVCGLLERAGFSVHVQPDGALADSRNVTVFALRSA